MLRSEIIDGEVDESDGRFGRTYEENDIIKY